MRGSDWIIVIVAILIIFGIMYGADEPIKVYIPKKVNDRKHVDECIDGYLFRHFYQGDKLITTIQVMSNSRLYPSNPREGVSAKAKECNN